MPSQYLPSYSFIMFLAFASFGSYIFSSDTLRTARPSPNNTSIITAIKSDSVPARLWQDPYRIIYQRYQQASRTKKDSKQPCKAQNVDCNSENSTSLLNKIEHYFKEKESNELLVMGVLVSSEAIAEAEERRRRDRYAVISALSEADFVPEDANHIQLATLDMVNHAKAKSMLEMPYEWFRYDKQNDVSSRKVLLLWLNAKNYKKKPYEHIHQLINKLACIKNECKKLRFVFIGPTGSDGLKTLIDKSYLVQPHMTNSSGKKINQPTSTKSDAKLEISLSENIDNIIKSCEKGVAGVHILSHRATVDDNRLYKIENKKSQQQTLGQRLENNNCLKFTRTINSDDDLMVSLSTELKSRHIGEEHSHIVLLSELDTVFGRTLPASFIEKFCGDNIENTVTREKNPGKEDSVKSKAFKKCESHVHMYNYLRGIDGIAPGSAEDIGLKSSKASTLDKKNSENNTNSMIRRPIGAGQFDYIRRVADELVRLDKNIRRHNGNGIRAIGILGSDVYDKLLILHALRSRLMGVTYFTTDLDAQFLHKDEYDWTRNMIIATSFGLRLSECFQKKTPPFRDNYQTSLFYSATLALQIKKSHFKITSTSPVTSNPLLFPVASSPLLFEIGRNGVVSLQENKKSESNKESDQCTPLKAEKIHPFDD